MSIDETAENQGMYVVCPFLLTGQIPKGCISPASPKLVRSPRMKT